MGSKSLTPEQMESRVARFNKLESYQKQNFDKHNIPPGAVEKVTARKVFPVMAPADYQGRSAGAPVKGPRGLIVSIAECEPTTARACTGISTRWRISSASRAASRSHGATTASTRRSSRRTT